MKDGSLALARTTPTSEAGVHGPAWAEEVVREFKSTLSYIARFGYTAEEGLDVVILCSSIDKQFFDEGALPVTNFRCLTPVEGLAAIGAKGIALGETNFGDALHAAWAGKKHTLGLPVTVPSIRHIMVPRLVSKLASVALGFTLVGMIAFLFSTYGDYSTARSDADDLHRRKELLAQEYAQDSKVFDAYPVRPDVIKSVLAVKEVVDGSTVNITPTLNVLRRAIGNDVKISSLTFSHDASDVFRMGEGAGKGAFPQTAPDPEKLRGSVRISFKFTLVGGQPLEQKVKRVQGLMATLKSKFPGYDVNIVRQFGNVSSGGKFEGKVGKTQQSDAPQEDAAEIEMKGTPL